MLNEIFLQHYFSHCLLRIYLCGRLTGEIWTLKFHCIGAQPGKEIVTVNIDKAYVAFYNVVYIKSKLGYSGRDFLFYKKRCGIERSRLVALDYIHQEEAMISDNVDERKISFVLTKDPPSDLEVSITPIKRPRQRTNVDEETIEVSIDAYKEWLAILQHDNPETGKLRCQTHYIKYMICYSFHS